MVGPFIGLDQMGPGEVPAGLQGQRHRVERHHLVEAYRHRAGFQPPARLHGGRRHGTQHCMVGFQQLTREASSPNTIPELADDGVLMLGAYSWACVHPIRRLAYNLTVTAASVLVALVIGIIEAPGVWGEQARFGGRTWSVVASLNGATGILGLSMIGLRPGHQ
jgi:hypothetical protein